MKLKHALHLVPFLGAMFLGSCSSETLIVKNTDPPKPPATQKDTTYTISVIKNDTTVVRRYPCITTADIMALPMGQTSRQVAVALQYAAHDIIFQSASYAIHKYCYKANYFLDTSLTPAMYENVPVFPSMPNRSFSFDYFENPNLVYFIYINDKLHEIIHSAIDQGSLNHLRKFIALTDTTIKTINSPEHDTIATLPRTEVARSMLDSIIPIRISSIFTNRVASYPKKREDGLLWPRFATLKDLASTDYKHLPDPPVLNLNGVYPFDILYVSSDLSVVTFAVGGKQVDLTFDKSKNPYALYSRELLPKGDEVSSPLKIYYAVYGPDMFFAFSPKEAKPKEQISAKTSVTTTKEVQAKEEISDTTSAKTITEEIPEHHAEEDSTVTTTKRKLFGILPLPENK